MKKLSIALAATLAILAGCASDGGGSESGATVLQAGNHSSLKDQTEEQYHDSAAFQAAWTKIYTGQGSTPALPNIDFTKNTVVMYAIGEKKTNGWSIRVDHAGADGAGYTVGFTVNQPGNNCSRSGNETTDPFIVASVPTTAQVTFDQVKIHQIPPCT